MMKKLFFAVLALALSAIMGGAVFAQVSESAVPQPNTQSEHILSFDSHITVHADSTLKVKETITVYANGETIKHGIYRDVPTTYKDQLGNAYRVVFSVLNVKRDDHDEPFHLENRSNGKRVYIGDANTVLSPGIYTYALTYTVDRELGFFKDHDELYWNVTGNGWDYTIDSASATVVLPPSVPMTAVTTNGYTGVAGSTGPLYTATVQPDGVHFATTRMLAPSEGLTIVVMWPKGYVAAPSTADKIKYFFADNIYAFVPLTAFAILFLYYLFMWRKVGRDPKRGTIIAQYDAPDNLSPAAIRYLSRMSYDNTVLTAAILSMAVQGYLTITDDDGTYSLTKVGADESTLADEERAVGVQVFEAGKKIIVAQEQHSFFEAAERKLKDTLRTALAGYVVTNGKYSGIGVIFSLFGIFSTFMAFPLGGKSIDPFTTFLFSSWTIGTFAVLYQIVQGWKTNMRTGLFFSIISVPFIVVEGVFISMMDMKGGFVYVVFLVATVALNSIFLILLPRRTPAGRSLQDRIDGFRLFLSVAEKDRMNFYNPPERTPELFEKFLPYALALGVEQQWAEQFDDVFQQLTQSGQPYTPLWYVGSAFRSRSLSAFTSGFSYSFGGAISASSTPPGSSSGGRGGFSGGGGGGGGGGGW